MARRMILVASVCCTLCASASVASAQQPGCRQSTPVNTLEEMWNALGKCWKPPAGSSGQEVTVRFSLRRDGSLNGKPQITWLKQGGTESQRRVFVASVFGALDAVLPIPFTEAMGSVAAGRPMTMRFSSPDLNERTL